MSKRIRNNTNSSDYVECSAVIRSLQYQQRYWKHSTRSAIILHCSEWSVSHGRAH